MEYTTLNLSGNAPKPIHEQVGPKNSAVAFFAALMIPGAGQAYCGERLRAIMTFLFFALSAGLTYFLFTAEESTNPQRWMLWGVCIRAAIALYVFAFLDAYYTAREINDGTYAYQAYNPRVAAILNLLTRGFGYWYLGEKKIALVVFFVVGGANRVVMGLPEGKTKLGWAS